MKAFRYSEDVLPVGEFKTHISSVLRKLSESGRPVIITQNGRPAAVLISPEEFDQLLEEKRFVQAVRQGLLDAEAGRTVDDKQLEEELDREFGKRRKS